MSLLSLADSVEKIKALGGDVVLVEQPALLNVADIESAIAHGQPVPVHTECPIIKDYAETSKADGSPLAECSLSELIALTVGIVGGFESSLPLPVGISPGSCEGYGWELGLTLATAAAK